MKPEAHATITTEHGEVDVEGHVTPDDDPEMEIDKATWVATGGSAEVYMEMADLWPQAETALWDSLDDQGEPQDPEPTP